MYAFLRMRLAVIVLAALGASFNGLAADGHSQDQMPPGSDQAAGSGLPASSHAAAGAAKMPDFTALIERQGPSVVNVITSRKLSVGRSPGTAEHEAMLNHFRRFVPNAEQEEGPHPPVMALGSGFIISRDGLVLTNAHVVAEAQSVTIRLADGKREFEGKILGADSRSDVALVKIDADNLPVANLGTSTTVKPGEWVAAIGAPFGFRNTITAGIVSATDRSLPTESFVSFIQTDVPMNPGSSGGPLLNVEGEVIGINSMIYSRTGGYMGVSFAIPIEVALDVAKQLQSYGRVRRGRFDVDVQPITRELAQAFKLQSLQGVLVGLVEPGSQADKARLKSGDVILTYNGKAIVETNDLPRLAADCAPGSQATLEIWRNGAKRTLAVPIVELPAEQEMAASEPPPPPKKPAVANRLGLVVREVPADQRKKLGIERGLLVEEVNGPAAATPIRPGDLIVTVNQAQISSLAEFNRLIARQRAGDSVALLIRRGNNSAYVALKVPTAAARSRTG